MLERILRFSIGHRGLVLLVTAGVAIVGGYSLWRLPIDAVPDITNNQVQINAVAEALSPIEVEKQVTFPIETALAGIPGLEYTRSLSRNGFSQVTAVFEDDIDIYFARQQVGERLLAVGESLPADVEPEMGPVSTGLGEVSMWTVEYEHPGGVGARAIDGIPGWQTDGTYRTPEGERLADDVAKAAYLRTVQDWVIRPQLMGLEGLAGVDSIGGYVKQVHVQPDPMKLVSFGLTFQDVIESLERNNASVGAGYVEQGGESYVVRAPGRIENLEQVAEIAVAMRGEAPIRVRDVATLAVGGELRTGSATEDGEEVVVGTALMRIGANSRTVAQAVEERMARIAKSLPPGVRVKTVLDRTKLVNATIHTVVGNLSEGALLVIVVLFLLLGNLRAALITALVIPLAMLMAAAGMLQAGVSGNLMSLGAVDFGLLVDGAVIVVENCVRVVAERQRAAGRALTPEERRNATVEAGRQVLGAAVFGGFIIVVVYVPILALTGIEGKMFRPMAITVILALVAAFALALTFVPAALAAGLGRVRERENPLVRLAARAYKPTVAWAISRPVTVVTSAVAMLVVSAILFSTLGQEFVPTLDEGDFAVHAMRIPGTGLAQSTLMQVSVERVVKRFPEVAFVFSKTGTAEVASDPMPPNVSDTFIILKSRADWPDPRESKESLRLRLEAALRELPGNNYEFTQPIQMRFNELIAGVRGDVAVKVYGERSEEMGRVAQAVARALRGVAGVADLKVEQAEGLPTLSVEIDREAIARFGLSVADVQDVVAVAVGGRAAGQVFEGDRRFDLVVRLPEAVRRDLEGLEDLPIPIAHPGGEPESPAAFAAEPDDGADQPGFIPLGMVARLIVAEGANQISRENGKRRIIVQANVRGRDIGSFVAEAQSKVEAEVPLPPGIWLDWGGQFENMVAARERLTAIVPICFFLIFLLLFRALGSVKHALIVFTGVPLALTGGTVALWVRDMPFSISAGVGFIALSGVAVLNGLVMITFVNQLRRDGTPLRFAVGTGTLARLRPVLMTALVASLGFVPMALATGTGAEVQRPLATVVIGGLVSSTLLTLIVLPALYVLVERETAERSPAVRS